MSSIGSSNSGLALWPNLATRWPLCSALTYLKTNVAINPVQTVTFTSAIRVAADVANRGECHPAFVCVYRRLNLPKNVQFSIIIAFQKTHARKCGNCTSCCKEMREMYGKLRAVQAEKRSFPPNPCTSYLSCRSIGELNVFWQRPTEDMGEMNVFRCVRL